VVEQVVIENLKFTSIRLLDSKSPLASASALPVSVTTYPITVGGGGGVVDCLVPSFLCKEVRIKFNF
jgi:hypothetical protein